MSDPVTFARRKGHVRALSRLVDKELDREGVCYQERFEDLRASLAEVVPEADAEFVSRIGWREVLALCVMSGLVRDHAPQADPS